ncbi:MAG TPA: hypothetical protein VNB22_07155 [Pyrinomonadaceae bacterium]|nr:hypothetical protein [Pyrinomonadaceae bacterium]
MLISAGCGKRKPPLPPVEKVAQRVEISGFQRGNKIQLSWTMAARNASDGSVLNISRADVYRLTEPANSSSNLSEEDFASRSTLIATIPISDSDFARKQMTFTDTLNFAGQSARIRYAIRFANATGQKAGFSNFLVIEPTAKVADVPKDLKSEVTQNSIAIKWNSPIQNIDGSTPANILGFNIYRMDDEKNIQKVLNNSPVTTNEFSDKSFEFERNYTYFVRTVSLGSNGEPLESADSEIIKVSPKDNFPPGAPGAVTIAASPNTISIFFASNIENDIAGYKVYRSTDRNLPKPDWSLMTPQLLTTNTFQDTTVESGKTYFYYLIAIDKFGNASDMSDVVSETVP